MKKLNNTIAVTTAWTEVEPNWDIHFYGIKPVDGTVEVAYYDDNGWSTEEVITNPDILDRFINCSKIRIRSTGGTVNLSYSLVGRFIFIKEKTEKINPVDGDLVLIADSADSYNKKKLDVFYINPILYDELPPIFLLSAREDAANTPTLTSFLGNTKQFTFAINDFMHGNTEVIHGYKEGTNIEAHIHWAVNGIDIDNRTVKWELEYTWANKDGSFGATTTISAETTIIAGLTDKTHIVTSIGTIIGTDINIGAYLIVRIRRIASSGTEPSNNPFGIAVGFHALYDTVGSRQLYVK